MNRQNFQLVVVAVFILLSLGQSLSVGQGSTIIYRQFHNSEPSGTSLFPSNVRPVYCESGPGQSFSFPLDLNGDGVTDFEVISRVGDSLAATTLATPNGAVLVFNEFIIIAGHDDIFSFSEGELVGGDEFEGITLWASDTFYGTILAETTFPLPNNLVFGPVLHIGLQFQIDGEPHFAWLRIQPFVLPTGVTGALLYDYAYESRPNTPIVVGAGRDTDHDGVWDFLDQCPATPAGEVVDAHGCSVSQLCPCSGPWKNHGEYVSAFERIAKRFWQEGRITRAQMSVLVKRAATSNCGKPCVTHSSTHPIRRAH